MAIAFWRKLAVMVKEFIIASAFLAVSGFGSGVVAQEVQPQITAKVVTENVGMGPAHISGPKVAPIAPIARQDHIPTARWDFRPEGRLWTRTTLEALKGHGRPLLEMVPRDMGDWCPGYAANGIEKRAEFWNGFLSALAKHESTWKPRAVGGGGLWYGLTQILPDTARGYKCRVGSGEALKNGSANLSCAVRIMAHTVKRDNAVARKANGRLGGVGADWGPMTKASKRREMARWLHEQNYCKLLIDTKPLQRPDGLAEGFGEGVKDQEIVQAQPPKALVD